MPAAIWTASAQPITARQAIEHGYVDLGELADHADLAAATIRDALSRPPIEDPTVPLGALSRPAARIGGIASPDPMWSREQVAEFDRRRAAQDGQVSQSNPDLPDVSAEEARKQGLASIRTLSQELGLAPNTLRRWSRTYKRATLDRPAFPPEVAMARREPPHHRGRQHRLRNREAVMEWVIAHTNADSDVDALVAS
jgi:transposase-like protein